MSEAIIIERLTSDDWRLWRELRLEALREASYAFSSTLADWQGERDSEVHWRRRLDTVPLNLIAYLDGKPAGMVSGTEPSADASVELISMYVAPFARGAGVGNVLVDTVVAWAAKQEATRVTLAVREANSAAIGLYRRNGFVEVGGADPDERIMVRTVESAS